MKETRLGIILILASFSGILLMNSAFIVDQTKQVVVTQFGDPVGTPIKEPGLHWKVPFMQELHEFDNRILEWDGYQSEIPTRDKKFIWIDVTGRWRIEDPLKFLKTVHNEKSAQSRLDDIMDGITRNLITRHNLVDVVRSTNDILKVKASEEDISAESDYEKIEDGREAITRAILTSASSVVKDYGIELIDLRIKRIKFVASVQQKVFERMVSERKRSAEQLRSEGQGVRAEIQGQTEKELKKIQSESYREAQKIKGQADAEANKIYGDAFSKDPNYYAFTAALERYPDALRGSSLVLSTDNDFLKALEIAES